MPINKYTGGGLKKLKKGELLSHVVELYGFIDLFDGVSLTKTIEENKKLKEEKRWADNLTARECHEMFLSKEELLAELEKARKANVENFAGMVKFNKENEKLKEENKKLKRLRKADAGCNKRMIKTTEENKKLKEIITKMACSGATTDLCMECWIVHEQIDPHLLLGNADEFYKQDENGKWRVIDENQQ